MATRRNTRRMGNENAAVAIDPKRTVTTMALKPAAASKRVTRSSLAGPPAAALGVKNTNKPTAVTDDAAGPSKPSAIAKPVAKTQVRPRPAPLGQKDDVFVEEAKPIVKRKLKSTIRQDTTVVRSKAIVQPAKTAGVKRANRVEASDEVVLSDDEEEKPSKKRQRVEEVQDWDDLDAGDEEDPLMVTEYVHEVYDYLREVELQSLAAPNYMEAKQEDITWRMRGILMDWLIEIHSKFRLLPETIFLTANIIDRFCSVRSVSVIKYQLMGVTALFIASKYEEIMCPSMSNFLFMTDGGYTDEEFLKAERYVLQMIGWDLSYPNPINFLRRISKADDYDIQSRTVAKYFMELTVVDSHFVGRPPSEIAAAAAWLARKVLDRGEWDANLIHYSGYTELELLPCAQLMIDYVARSCHFEDGTEHPNFNKKYASRKFFKASEIVREWVHDTWFDNREALALIKAYKRASKNVLADGLSSPANEKAQARLYEWERYE